MTGARASHAQQVSSRLAGRRGKRRCCRRRPSPVSRYGGPESLESRRLLTVTLGVDTFTIAEADDVATITASLAEVREVDVSVDLSVSGTAVEFADYTLSSKRITIPAGSLTGDATLTSLQDSTDEEDVETVVVEIAEVVNDTELGTQLQTIVILDDDPPPGVVLSINDGSILENGGVATLKAALSAASERPVSIDLAFSGTARLGNDFTAPSQIVVPAGSLLRTIAIDTKQDTLDESDETVVVTVTGVTNGLLTGPVEFETTILDDDPEPTIGLSIDAAAIIEASGVGVVTASLSAASGRDVAVTLDYSGTASRGADYSAPDRILIPSGSLSGTAEIIAIQDELSEPAESIIVGVSEPTNAVGDGRLITTTVVDDDTLPEVSLSLGATALLEDSGSIQLTASLAEPTGREVVIELEYRGTATAGVDFTPAANIVIPIGSLASTVELVPIADTLDEGDETVTIGIASVINAVEVMAQEVTATIQDDDPAPLVELSINEPRIPEAAGLSTITATLSEASSFDVVVALSYTGSATRGIDYTVSSGQIIVPAGSIRAVAAILAIQDLYRETDETIVVDVIVVANGQEAETQQVIATIEDDDELPTVTLSVDTPTLPESPSTATVTASLSAQTALDVTVDLVFSGSATEGVDYSAVGTQQLVIPAGSLQAMTTITSVQDSQPEGSETIVVDLAAVKNGIASVNGQVTVTILDDDRLPDVSLSITPESISETGGVATVTATLSDATGLPVTVDLSFRGLAIANVDYSASASQIVVPPGSRKGSATIVARADLLDEPEETVSVEIGGVKNANQVSPTAGTLTIIDDDPPPNVTLKLSSETLLESLGTVTVSARLANISALPVTVDLQYSGTATSEIDFVTSASQIVIPAGSFSSVAVIAAVEDSIDEPGETVVIEIVDTTNGAELDEQVVVATILDNDLPPLVTLQSETNTLDEASGVSRITASLSAISSLDIAIQLGYSGTATLGADYTSSSLEIVIPAGSTTGSTLLTALQDSLDELDELVVIDVNSVANGRELDEQQLRITIEDDDAAPTVLLEIDNSALAESGGSVTVTALLSAPSELNVTVDFEFLGTALTDTDYSVSGTQIVIPAGALRGSVSITAIPDGLEEVDETIVAQSIEVTNAELVGTDRVTVTIVDGNSPPALIQGRAFHDRNSSNVRDSDEEFLHGWVIELVDANGQLVATQRTRDIDLDSSGVIDPETETGLYEFAVTGGDYFVRAIVPVGWRNTFPTNAMADLAFELDQQLDFFVVEGFFENWGGQGERWLQAAADGNQWYYVTTDGELRRWDNMSGAPLGSILRGEFVASLDASFHADPTQFIDVAAPESGHRLSVNTGEVEADFDFGNLQLASIRGRSFHDSNANGIRDFDDQYLNGWTIELLNAAGMVVAVQVTREFDLDLNGATDPLTERGWYRFDGLEPGTYSVREMPRTGWRQTSPIDPEALMAVVLDQQFDFFTTGNLWEGYGGAGERWLQSAKNSLGWFFITPDGNLVEWDNASGTQLGTPLGGTLIATLPRSFFDDPTRLVDATAESLPHQVVLESGQAAENRDFGNLQLVTLAPAAALRPAGEPVARLALTTGPTLPRPISGTKFELETPPRISIDWPDESHAYGQPPPAAVDGVWATGLSDLKVNGYTELAEWLAELLATPPIES